MTSAAESFVIALGRASSRSSYHLRGLQRADRDDVTATALLWCWQNRSTYTPQISLEEWFLGALRNARRSWQSGEGIRAENLSEHIPVADNALAHAEAMSAAQQLTQTATPEQCEVAILQAQGLTRAEIMKKLHVSKRTVDLARKHLSRLRRLMPDSSEVITALRTRASAGSNEGHKMAKIDRDIEKLYKPELGGSSVFADDYRMGERVRVKEEDIRNTVAMWSGGVNLISDYEGDAPNRRLALYTVNNDTITWVAEAHATLTENIYVRR